MASPFRVTAMFVTGAFCLLLSHSSAAAPTSCSPEADPCGRLSELNKQYADLQLVIVQDQAMLQDLGFRGVNPEQFDREAQYYDALMKEHPIASLLKDASLNLALELIKRNLDGLTPTSAASMAVIIEKLPGLGPGFAKDITELGTTPAGQARLAKYNIFLDKLGPTLSAFNLGMAETRKDILIEGFNQMAGTVLTDSTLLSSATRATPLPMLAAIEIGVVTPLVVDVAQGAWHWPSVYRLLELNESQLAITKMYTKQMKSHIDQRKQIMTELKTIDIAACDSTKLAGKKANGKKGGNPTQILILGGAAVAGGLALASAMPLLEESAATCGAAPTIPMSCLGIGRSSSCNDLIARYSQWCSCMGRTFDTSSGACR